LKLYEIKLISMNDMFYLVSLMSHDPCHSIDYLKIVFFFK
jgi:hypothetical protein